MAVGGEVMGRLADFVTADEKMPELGRRLIDSFLVVRDEEALVRLAASDPGLLLVTPSGCSWCGDVGRSGDGSRPDGRIVVGPKAGGRLGLEALLEKNELELGRTREKLSELQARTQRIEAEKGRLEAETGSLRQGLVEVERRKSSLDATHEAVRAQRGELDRDAERVRGELVQLGRARPSDPEKLKEATETLVRVGELVQGQTKALAKLREQIEKQEREVRAGLDESSQNLALLGEQRQKVQRLSDQSDYARRGIEERRRQIAELVRAQDQAQGEVAALEAAIRDREGEIQAATQALEVIEAKIDRLLVSDLAKQDEELENQLSLLRRAREQNQSILLEQRLKLHELGQQRERITEAARSEYRTEIADYQPPDEADITIRLAKIRERIEALGKVNPLADEEYRQEKQDLDRVRVQRDDVAQARDNLLLSIAEIDRHARERFLETYENVRNHFREVFQEMFLEGEADLVLVDTERPLESEIAIIAKPRGKIPKRLEQLSDGEKALLAVSLLFAFYRVKPAPFCFLDEVDAPLDDANVGRFADYLKRISERTQVVIITHNRLTVERADMLFGVTAEQPGISKLVSVDLADYQETRGQMPESPVVESVTGSGSAGGFIVHR